MLVLFVVVIEAAPEELTVPESVTLSPEPLEKSTAVPDRIPAELTESETVPIELDVEIKEPTYDPANLFTGTVVTVSDAASDAEPSLAVILSTVWAATLLVDMEKVADDAPAATFTVLGKVTDDKLPVSVTLSPLTDAGPLRVTVPVEAVPPVTVLGFSVSPVRVAGLIVRVTPIEVVARVAVIFAAVLLATGLVTIEHAADVLPEATSMLAGTEASLWLLASLIVIPPIGAADEIVAVPLESDPPAKLVGFRTNEESVGALTVKLVEAELEPSDALIAVTVVATTDTVATVNVAVVFPDSTVTEEGGVAEDLEDASVTTVPLAPAFLEMVTVAVADTPPTTLVGDRLSFVTV